MTRIVFVTLLAPTLVIFGCSSEPAGTGGGGTTSGASSETSVSGVANGSTTSGGPQACHATLAGTFPGAFDCEVLTEHADGGAYELEIRPTALPTNISGTHLFAQHDSSPFATATLTYANGLDGEFDVNGMPAMAAYQSNKVDGTTATLVLTEADDLPQSAGATHATHGTLDVTLIPLPGGVATGSESVHVDF